MKKIFCLILLAFTLVGLSFAQGNLGQSGANFLQIAVEPQGAALGGAVTALTSGAAALYWNPAGAVQTRNLDLNFSHTNWFLDTKLMYAAAVKNLGALGAFGLSFTSFYMDEMELTSVYDSEGASGAVYNAGDLAVGLSYARSLTDRFTFGVTAKYVREEIWNESADQLAFDVGSLYRTDFYKLRLGIAIRNFAGKMAFSGSDIDARVAEEIAKKISNNPRVERLSSEFRLPQVFQMGIAFEPIALESNRFTVLADVDVPSDNTQRVIFGAEYGFRSFAYLRAAYRHNYDAGDFSFGGGLNLNLAGLNARLDYAFSTHGVLNNVHRFGFGISL